MQQPGLISGTAGPVNLCESPTQLALGASNSSHKGPAMQVDAIDYRVSQSGQRTLQDDIQRKSLLTPARRAALDALEREFHELLNARPQAAA